jgi:lipopolysaccharide O-acetyltransferase
MKTSRLFALFRANRLGIALQLTASRSWAIVRSSFMSVLLRAPGLHIGPGCRIIGVRHISFGRGIFVERNLWLEAVTSYASQSFDPNISIGDYVCFSDGVHVSAINSIKIGKNTLFGSRIYVSDHNHGVYRGELQSAPDEPPAHRRLGGGGPVVIGENVWIGDNTVIVGPVTIGNGAIVGANSVLRGSVPPNTMVVGAPAKPIKIFNPNTRSWEKL